MSTITSTVFVTLANNPYTLAAGNTISVSSALDSDIPGQPHFQAGEAIYTVYSPTNATTIGGATITIDGVVIDNSTPAIADEYGIQSKAAADATILNFGLISAPHMFAAGINSGLIVNELHSTITGAGGIRIGGGTLASTIINEGTLTGTSAQGIDALVNAELAYITNTASGIILGGGSGGSISESGIYIDQGTITNAGKISQGAAAGFSVDFFSNAGGNELILDPGQVLTGIATASGTGNILALGSGSTIGTIANPGNYRGFETLSVASGADWQIGTAAGAVSFSGISTIADFGTVDILGSITGTTLNLEGNGAHSAVEFNAAASGTNLDNAVTDFGMSDSIVISGFDLKAGEEIVYNYTKGNLSVSANSTGNGNNPTRLTENFDLTGPGGVDFGNSTGIATSGIQTGAFTFTTLANGDLVITANPGAPYTFTGSADTNFDNGANYVGGFPPGYTLTPDEDVSIISGTATISSPTLDNNGTIIVTGTASQFVSAAPIGGTGTIDIAAGGHVTLGGTTVVTNEISFGTGGSALNPNLLDLSGTGSSLAQLSSVANFGTFDTIIVTGFTPIAGDLLIENYDSSTGLLSVTELDTNPLHGDENFSATITGPGAAKLNIGNFIFSDGPNGLVISDQPCFAAGTRILTPYGDKPVERLAVGDEVLTAREGHEDVAEIIWVGQRTIDLARHAMPEKVRPVRILAGAVGPGLPERDLVLSPDHALFIDGHLIEAKTLVNGVTVIVERNTRYVTYHHIELATHDVVLAEGLPAETYLESGNRANFESKAAPITLHPDFVTMSRKKACAKLLVDGKIVINARQKLLDRAMALGFSVTGDVDLVVKAGLERIRPSEGAEGDLLFMLPAGAKDVRLLSGTGVPAEISADPSDRRVLGVAVASLALVAGGVRHSIPLDDAAHEGFHEMEAGHRWTKGEARIALPPYSGRAVLEVAIHGQAARWALDARSQLSG